MFFSKGYKVPTASDTRWVYHCQLADFAWMHMVSIVSALIEIHESNKEGTSDKFSMCLGSTVARIENTLEEFDYEIYKQKIKDCRDALPLRQRTAHSTRSSNSTSNTPNDNHMDTKTNLNIYCQKIVNSTLESIKERFVQDSRIIIDNISMFTKVNDYSDDQVLKNPLLNIYCNQVYYKH